ncbi:hypothetical protein G7Z17_g7403 [Cylindrodendrum hubeiense]|uniref:Peroxisomal membrane protein PEX14 n=1 Tax=Cylindrodendrum hubeiense TaxID=595255 RepID=A0A9P5H764_9HYPO|nr:hypothetical protein G7Z17_g7403 [Cylindrodendrum hubeiense]
MAIREDLVASAAQFLQDPSVASSSVENRISFLRTKNLTEEEIDVAMSRAGGNAPPPPSAPYPSAPPQGPPVPQQYYQPYPPQAWQPPPAPPKRDWRDWFIMATVVSGVSYGLFSLGKRYVYPLVAPPTPEKLEQDKKSIEEQFDRAFTLVEQLAQDTEVLKKAEQERTEKLDNAISELETVMSDLKAANRRREDDSQRIRDEVQSLKDAIPKALDNQKQLTDDRLKEINGELTSLKTLVSQRMTPSTPAPVTSPSFLRGTSASVTPAVSTPTVAPSATPVTNGEKSADVGSSAATTPVTTPVTTPAATAAAAPKSHFNRASTSGLGASTGKASIPAWQMAMAKQNDTSSTLAKADEPEAGGSSSSS